MLDEIIPTLKPGRQTKVLAATDLVTAALPPVKSKISFQPLLKFLEEKQHEVSAIKASCYRLLIRKISEELSINENGNLLHIPAESATLLELLSSMLFPLVSKDERLTFALATPYKFQVFYYSDCFRQLFMNESETELLLPENLSLQEIKNIECSMIYDQVLNKFYGIKLNDSPDLVYQRIENKTGLKKFYRIRYDRRFIDVHLKGELPNIKDCAVCMNTFRILDLEKQLKTMPLDLFEIEGFAVWVAEDVTTSEALETIKKILLHQHEYNTHILKELKEALHVLVGLSDVEIGLMPFVKINEEFVLEEDFTSHGIVSKYWKAGNDNDQVMFQNYIAFLHEMSEPMPVTSVSEEMMDFAPFMRKTYEEGTRSFISYPLGSSDGLIGMLELASPVKNLLTHETMSRLEPVIPMLSLALLKYRDLFYQQIDSLIKEKFTALQHPVEWKFAEVAWQNLKQKGNDVPLAKVSFENVYPLYGAIDVRSSSEERSNAIQKDLKQHLQLIDQTLDRLHNYISLPLLEGIKFKTQEVKFSIEETLLTKDEMYIKDFIENEVHPVLAHLQKSENEIKNIANEYFKIVDDHKSILYHHRKEYEQAIATINDSILEYLEDEENKIQLAYPHYFERFRTDGIDYNIYIGQSISPHRPFDLLYLKNLRLWQLSSMAEIARLTHRLLPQMKLPLLTTQLILVHSQTLTINFRSDERKFDVEGSYNMRYETAKKRLDKVLIKNTGERLTQPGKIAVVYSSPKEQTEYQEYFQFLQNKNILNPGVELLELEELQGIYGLKAMRVEVVYDK